MPVAAIITAAFVREAEVQRAALGAASLDPVVIAHPLSTLSDDQIGERAADAARQITAVLTGTTPAAEAPTL